MSIRTNRMTTTNIVKNYYESEQEDDHTSDSDYVEEYEYSSESEDDEQQYNESAVADTNIPSYKTRRQVRPKTDADTIKITSIQNSIIQKNREKKEKKKLQTKKMSKVRGYKRVRILDGPDWTCSLDPDRMRTRSEHKRYKEERKINEDMLMRLEADGHLLRYNDNDLLVLCK